MADTTALTECQCEHVSHEIGCSSTQDLTVVRSSWGALCDMQTVSCRSSDSERVPVT